MERKAKITQEAVNTACEELHQADKAVTVNGVIAAVGGSFSTVGPMVKQWKQEQAEQIAPLLPIPDSINQAMHKATADIWTAATTLAGEQIERIQKESAVKVDAARNELQEYTGEVSRLESELEQANELLARSQKNLEGALEKINKLESEKVALKTHLSDRDEELKLLRAGNEKLQAELIDIAKRQVDNQKGNKK